MEFKQAFGIAFQKTRLAKGLSKKEVSKKAKISLSTIQKVESRLANPALTTIARLAKGLSVDMYFLMSLTESIMRRQISNSRRKNLAGGK